MEFRALGCRRARIRATASIPVRAFSGRAGYYKVFLFFQAFMQTFYRLVQGLLRFSGFLSRISCRASRRGLYEGSLEALYGLPVVSIVVPFYG